MGDVMTHIRQWYDPKNLFPDFLAGITGAVAGAPQAMGFAILAGISPLYGLYSAFVATIVGALFTNSALITVGPTNALALVVGSTLIRYDEGSQVEHLFVLTLVTGLFQLAFGILRLGSLTRFVSNAVMTGFITGAGTLIMLGQLSHLNGYESESHSSSQLLRLWDWLIHLPESDVQTTIIGVTAVVIIYGLHHTKRYKSIATLVAILITSVFVALAGWDAVPLVIDESPIPTGWPAPILPELNLLSEHIAVGFALATLGSAQSAALSASIQEPYGRATNVTRDLSGQGVANIAASVFQGMPTCGSLSRTAVNISAGAQTRMANIFAGILIGLILLLLGQWIEQITLAALAGHLIVAAASLIKLDNIRMVWKVDWSARMAMVVTFASTWLFPLEYSIYIGVGLSLLFYVRSSAVQIQVRRLLPMGNNQYQQVDVPDTLPPNEIVILSVTGNLYFAAIKQLEDLLPSANTADHTVVILRLRDNVHLGSTGIRLLQNYSEQLQQRNSRLMLAGISESVRAQLDRTGFASAFGDGYIFEATDVYFAATDNALVAAEQWQRLQLT